MDKEMERELQSMREAVSRLADCMRNVSFWVDDDADLVGYVTLAVVALRCAMETLQSKLALETFADKL